MWRQPRRAFCSVGGMLLGSWRAAAQEKAPAKEPGQRQSKNPALRVFCVPPCLMRSLAQHKDRLSGEWELRLVHNVPATAGTRGKKKQPKSSFCWVWCCKMGRESTVSLARKEQPVLGRAKATVSFTVQTHTTIPPREGNALTQYLATK